MAEIVELQENGVAQYLKTHAKAVDGLREAIVEIIYPVGSIYTSEVSTDPSEILGVGSWDRIKGELLVGVDEDDSDFSDSGLSGGEKTHKLTIDEMPKHSFQYRTNDQNNLVKIEPSSVYGRSADKFDKTNELGLDKPHNNMPPYYTVYMWRRTV